MRGNNWARAIWSSGGAEEEVTEGQAAEVGEGEMAAAADDASSIPSFGGCPARPPEAWLSTAARLRSSKVIMVDSLLRRARVSEYMK